MQLSDLLNSTTNRQVIQQMSHQFGLSQDQTLQAIDALMPAFSTGLKRNASSPAGAAGLIEALATGRHARYADDPFEALKSGGIDEGNAILGHLFGKKDVSRAVAAQASSSTGIGSSILKQMLPMIASMVMGSLFKGSTGGGSSTGGGLGGMLGQAAGGGILGSLIEGLAGGALSGAGGATARSPRRKQTRGRSGGSLEDLLGGILGGQQSPRARRTQRRSKPMMPPTRTQNQQPSPQSGGGVFDELLGQVQRRQRQRNPQTPAPRQRRVERTRDTGANTGGSLNDIFGEMLEPGGNTSPEYQQETDSVFDELLGPGGRF